MKSIFLPFVLFFFPLVTTTLAQENDSLRNEILSRESSEIEIITKGRSLTLEHLQKGDFYALKEVKAYLAGETGNPYWAYLPVEYWLLSFWSEEYNILLEEAKQFSADIDWQGENYWEMPERYRPSSLLRMIAENERLSQEVCR